ncbi:iron-sulfur cluster assembly accessory protein [Lyngbya aestuarii]|uniref:iron-sulfur cluster assembly accessory protein n=1 Tax=Lyngbya aestuarii TaxID=118322 RepID=UPI00403E24E1
MALTFTEKAVSRLGSFLESDQASSSSPQQGIRVSVIDGGCNGYEYSLSVSTTPKTDDLLLENGGLRIYVDGKSVPLLEGVVIDYVEGLTQSGFKFSNPNAAETCSCGKSFAAAGAAGCKPSAAGCS